MTRPAAFATFVSLVYMVHVDKVNARQQALCQVHVRDPHGEVWKVTVDVRKGDYAKVNARRRLLDSP